MNHNINELRYRYLLILADQDSDGFHIKGLVMNWIHYEWPSLLKLDFIVSIATPIVRVSKNKTVKNFYNIPDFIKWKENLIGNNLSSWYVKYYKGLGTSNSSEAKEYFTDIEKNNNL